MDSEIGDIIKNLGAASEVKILITDIVDLSAKITEKLGEIVEERICDLRDAEGIICDFAFDDLAFLDGDDKRNGWYISICNTCYQYRSAICNVV